MWWCWVVLGPGGPLVGVLAVTEHGADDDDEGVAISPITARRWALRQNSWTPVTMSAASASA